MKSVLRNTALALLAVGFVVLFSACETLRPHGFLLEPIEDFGGAGYWQ